MLKWRLWIDEKSYNYVNCWSRNEYESDLCCNEHYLSSYENKAWKKKSSLYKNCFHIHLICFILWKGKCKKHNLCYCCILNQKFSYIFLSIVSIAGAGQDSHMVLTLLWHTAPRQSSLHWGATRTHIRSVVQFVFINKET